MGIEIKLGLELDRAVAGAIGLECTHRILGSDVEYYVDHRDGAFGIPERFQPSTDLNAAFAAAKKVSDYFVVTQNECSGDRWECKLSPHDDICEWVLGDTPALAICAAILKLKEQPK